MPDWLNGIDVSVYQGAILEGSWQALYDAHQRVAVVGSAHPRPNTYALENLRRAKRVGFILATYAVVYPGVPSARTIETARQMCGEFWPELAFVAIDCETDGITESQIFGMEEAIKAAGQRPILYTANWFWAGIFGNPQTFKHLPLWNAYYDGKPDLDFAKAPYGGWRLEDVVIEQYAGTVQLAGVTVDRNSFRADFLEGDLDMATAAELQQAIDDTRRFFADILVQQQKKLGGHDAAIKFLSEIAVNHEGRIKTLET